tara:strand:+ start:2383 stop:2769 length:387 start_codon:yes stop_codon:yes gene_type:complete
MERKIILLASLLGGIAVVLGAFAAHGLKPLLSVSAFDSLGTAIRYQMYHTFLLFYIGSTSRLNNKQQSLLYKLILSGILLFSGSIYLLSTNDLTLFNFKVIGFVTPLGGLFLISSWVLLFSYNLRNKS